MCCIHQTCPRVFNSNQSNTKIAYMCKCTHTKHTHKATYNDTDLGRHHSNAHSAPDQTHEQGAERAEKHGNLDTRFVPLEPSAHLRHSERERERRGGEERARARARAKVRLRARARARARARERESERESMSGTGGGDESKVRRWR